MRRRRLLQLVGLATVGAAGAGTAYTMDRATRDPVEERIERIDPDGFTERSGARRGEERYDADYDLFCDGVIDRRDRALYQHITVDADTPLEGWARLTGERSERVYRCSTTSPE